MLYHLSAAGFADFVAAAISRCTRPSVVDCCCRRSLSLLFSFGGLFRAISASTRSRVDSRLSPISCIGR